MNLIRSQIEEELTLILGKLLAASGSVVGSKGDLAKHRPVAKYSVDDRAVWISLSKHSKAFKVSEN